MRSLKYLLLGFFVFFIGITMSPTAMAQFMATDYYKIVDVRMMKFFTEMSTLTLWILVALLAFDAV